MGAVVCTIQLNLFWQSVHSDRGASSGQVNCQAGALAEFQHKIFRSSSQKSLL